jgi:hypothetical protein
MDEEFDSLFRKHLMNVYDFMGGEIPDRLHIPIVRRREKGTPMLACADLIDPCIDGKLTNYFEWLPAGFYDPSKAGDAMHRANPAIKGIYAGFNLEKMFLRIDVEERLLGKGASTGAFVQIHFLTPSPVRVEIELDSSKLHPPAKIYEIGSGLQMDSRKESKMEGLEAAIEKIVEVAIPIRAFRGEAGQEVTFIVFLAKNGKERERWPRSGYFRAKVPSEAVVSDFWQA